MQFSPDIERCIRNPMLVRRLSEPRRVEVLEFLRAFRASRHMFRASKGFGKYYPESEEWLKRRGYK